MMNHALRMALLLGLAACGGKEALKQADGAANNPPAVNQNQNPKPQETPQKEQPKQEDKKSESAPPTAPAQDNQQENKLDEKDAPKNPPAAGEKNEDKTEDKTTGENDNGSASTDEKDSSGNDSSSDNSGSNDSGSASNNGNEQQDETKDIIEQREEEIKQIMATEEELNALTITSTTEPLDPNHSPARRITISTLEENIIKTQHWDVGELKAGKWYEKETAEKNQLLFYGLEHAIMGFVDDTVFTNGALSLEQGLKAAGTGSASYRGDGLLKVMNNADFAYLPLKANIDVDFTAKTVIGKLKGHDHSFDFQATINENGEFESKDDAEVGTSGAFYGDKASELAGHFWKDSTFEEGVYSAKKDQN